jgi:putative phosphoesterase
MRRIALISDTHNLLRPEVLDGIAGVESILHLGDVCRPDLLDELQVVAPLQGVVRGNCDGGAWARALPRTLSVDLFGAGAYLVHDLSDLDVDPKAAGLRFVFYGHSHVPKAETRDGVRYVNPGSCGPRRFDLPISYAILHEDLRVEFVTVDA